MKHPDIDWIWFDLDDTLYDFASSSLYALGELFRNYGLNRYFASLEQWTDIYHRHNSALWQKYNRGAVSQQQLRHDRFYLPMTEAGIDRITCERLNAGLDRDYLDLLGSTGLLIEGAHEVVSDLRAKGYRIGILSNGFHDVQHQKLDSSRLAPLTHAVVLSDDAGFNKPDTRIFSYANALTGSTPDRSLMVGDNPDTDVSGALGAGWHAIYYAPGSKSGRAEVDGLSVRTISALKELISQPLNW